MPGVPLGVGTSVKDIPILSLNVGRKANSLKNEKTGGILF